MQKVVALISICMLLMTFTPIVAADATGQQYADVPVRINTIKGDPAYTVVIPDSIDLYDIMQDEDVYTHSFQIGIEEAKRLGDLKIYSVIRPYDCEEFELVGQNDSNNKLPYYIINKTHGIDTRVLDLSDPGSYFAVFEGVSSAECDFCIDTSLIEVIDTYQGRIEFLFYLDN